MTTEVPAAATVEPHRRGVTSGGLRDRLGRGFALTFALGLGWSLYRALTDQGWIIDDELSHYLFSRAVWDEPKELLQIWTRPGRNLIQFVPSYFGLTATRLWTLGLSAIAVWITGKEAQRRGLGTIWLLPLLVWFQWWFPELSYPVLTVVPLIVVWIAAIALAARGQLVLASIAFGMLGLIRHEAVVLTAMWGLWVLFDEDGAGRHLVERRVREAAGALPRAALLGAWTLLPMIAVNAAAYRMSVELPITVFFESDSNDFYGSGPLWLFTSHLVVGAGVPIIALFAIGLTRWSWRGAWSDLLYATYPAYFVLHSLVYWQGLFASGGYYAFIMPMAPWIGLVALSGVQVVRRRFGDAPVWALIPLIVWGGLAMPRLQSDPPGEDIDGIPSVAGEADWSVVARPLEEGPFGSALRQGADWVLDHGEGADWTAHHVAVDYFLRDEDVGPRVEPWHRDSTPEGLPPGTVLVWDAKYSEEFHGFSLNRLAASGWAEVTSFGDDSVRIFVKP